MGKGGNKMNATRLFGLLSCLMLIGYACSTASAEELKVGDDAPDFKLQGSDGKTYQLSDFKGKQAVVLAWFPKAFTGGCTKECTSLRESGDEIRKFSAKYFTASCDTAETNAEFAKSLSLDYPILSDPDKKVAQAYGVVNQERAVPFRWTFYIGKDGKILSIDKGVNTTSHGLDIAKALMELGIEQN
jgi:peroxiredoxin Q/BCP